VGIGNWCSPLCWPEGGEDDDERVMEHRRWSEDRTPGRACLPEPSGRLLIDLMARDKKATAGLTFVSTATEVSSRQGRSSDPTCERPGGHGQGRRRGAIEPPLGRP